MNRRRSYSLIASHPLHDYDGALQGWLIRLEGDSPWTVWALCADVTPDTE